MKNPKQQQTRQLQAYLLINIIVLVWASWLAWSRQITGLEVAIFRFINELPTGLLLLFLAVTQAGSAWLLFGLTLILAGLKKGRLALRVFGVGVSAFFATELLKQIVARPRPGLLLDNVLVRDHLLQDYGFPSGHTAIATAVGLVMLGIAPRRWRWLCWVGIIMVAVSRLYLGVHAPLDVVGGFAVGVIVVVLSLLIHGKLRTVRKITGLKLQG